MNCEELFGPIQQFWTENEDADGLLQFQFSRGKLTQETIDVTRRPLMVREDRLG